MPAPDSLAAWLTRATDADLVALLTLRPDLALPPPADSGVLAARAGLRASVARCADDLDTFVLTVWEALVLAGADSRGVSQPEVAALLGSDVSADQLTAALTALRRRALAWDGDEDIPGLRVMPAAREVLPRTVGRVGRASPQLVGVDVAALLRELDEPRTALLTTLAQGSPLGRTRDAALDTPADRPVPQLLAAGLLLHVDEQTVELPSQVSAVLRGDHRMGEVAVSPPAAPPTRYDVRAVDDAAAGQALEMLRHAHDVVTALAAAPAPVLRSGGIGVLAVRRLAKQTQLDEARVAFVLELLVGAGLVWAGSAGDGRAGTGRAGTGRSGDGSGEESWAPTTAVDAWLPAEPAARWSALAQGWLELTRWPAWVGRDDERGKPISALSDELRRSSAPRDRRRALGVLAELGVGGALATEAVEAVLSWRWPRWGGRARRDVVAEVLAEATAMGVLGRGALSTPGRALLLAPGTAAAAMAMALPEPLDHVLVQADLTVVAPGPLRPELEREIGLVADVESAGAATVYRVSPSSVRRALDGGRSADDLHDLFAQRSRTPVPQSLTYLIDDVARRHGRLRAGTAAAFLRCDDEALLAEVLASAVAGELGLRRLAPTVAISPAPLHELLGGLRAAGFAPVGEDAAGDVLDLRPTGARVAPQRPRRAPPTAAGVQQWEAVVRGVRAGDRAAGMTTTDRVVADGSRASGVATVAVLAQAAREHRSVWVGYVDAQGVASQRVVDPVSVGGGVLEGFDPGASELRRFALHRITSVALTEP